MRFVSIPLHHQLISIQASHICSLSRQPFAFNASCVSVKCSASPSSCQWTPSFSPTPAHSATNFTINITINNPSPPQIVTVAVQSYCLRTSAGVRPHAPASFQTSFGAFRLNSLLHPVLFHTTFRLPLKSPRTLGGRCGTPTTPPLALFPPSWNCATPQPALLELPRGDGTSHPSACVFL